MRIECRPDRASIPAAIPPQFREANRMSSVPHRPTWAKLKSVPVVAGNTAYRRGLPVVVIQDTFPSSPILTGETAHSRDGCLLCSGDPMPMNLSFNGETSARKPRASGRRSRSSFPSRPSAIQRRSAGRQISSYSWLRISSEGEAAQKPTRRKDQDLRGTLKPSDSELPADELPWGSLLRLVLRHSSRAVTSESVEFSLFAAAPRRPKEHSGRVLLDQGDPPVGINRAQPR
jgi:hypothetical protein